MVSLGLLASNTYAETDKPYKICPEIVTAKDTPCRVLGASALLAQRMEMPKPKEDTGKLQQEIQKLTEENEKLKKENEKLKNQIPQKIEKETPSVTRAIRG